MTMDARTFTRQDMVEEVARALSLPPEQIPQDENLVLLGLGSLEMMQLVNEWRRQGIDVNFRELVAHPTIGQWWARLAPGQDVQ
jgi:aryl carrier-like protein